MLLFLALVASRAVATRILCVATFGTEVGRIDLIASRAVATRILDIATL